MSVFKLQRKFNLGMTVMQNAAERSYSYIKVIKCNAA